jgi:hypothetical protein
MPSNIWPDTPIKGKVQVAVTYTGEDGATTVAIVILEAAGGPLNLVGTAVQRGAYTALVAAIQQYEHDKAHAELSKEFS